MLEATTLPGVPAQGASNGALPTLRMEREDAQVEAHPSSGSPLFATAESSAAASRPLLGAFSVGASLPGSWGRLELKELLGKGGMGRVFAAWDPALKRSVALKVLLGTEPVDVGRFVREARAQARVEHPAVCRVYEVGEVGGIPYIAMQLIRGETLGQAASGLSLTDRVAPMRLAAEGLHAAHRTGLIHRDLEPSSILVERTDDGRLLPYLVEVGLAQLPG